MFWTRFLRNEFQSRVCSPWGTQKFAKIQQDRASSGKSCRVVGEGGGQQWVGPGYAHPSPSRCSRRPAHPHSALQSGPGPTPHPHTSQGHRGYLADSICILFVLLRIPTLPAPGLGSWPGSKPDALASLLMFKEHISWWRGFGRKGPEKQNKM